MPLSSEINVMSIIKAYNILISRTESAIYYNHHHIAHSSVPSILFAM